jgi:hypothetical protein
VSETPGIEKVKIPVSEYLKYMFDSLLTVLSGSFPQYDGDVVAISFLSEEDLEMRELSVPCIAMKKTGILNYGQDMRQTAC